MPDKTDYLLWLDDRLCGQSERAVCVVYPDFSKAFSIVSHSILKAKLLRYELDKSAKRWIENWLDHQEQRIVISSVKSHWWMVSSNIPQG